MATPSTKDGYSSDDSNFEITKLICARKTNVSEVRKQIVEIVCANGKLGGEIDTPVPNWMLTRKTKPKFPGSDHVTTILLKLFQLSDFLRFDLKQVVELKQDINEARFPVELSYDVNAKSDEYSALTGIGKETTMKRMTAAVTPNEVSKEYLNSHSSTKEIVKWIGDLLVRSMKFVSDRGWDYAEEPTNLFLALTGEVGELAEVLQFHGEMRGHISNAEMASLVEEMADVFIYLVRFADSLRVLDDALADLVGMHKDKKSRKKAKKAPPS